jgi:hypothetical protein
MSRKLSNRPERLRRFVEQSFDYEIGYNRALDISNKLRSCKFPYELKYKLGLEEETIVRLNLVVSKDGMIQQLDVEKSSGNDSMDAAAIQHSAAALSDLAPFSDIAPASLQFLVGYHADGRRVTIPVFEEPKDKYVQAKILPVLKSLLVSDAKLLRQASIVDEDAEIGLVVQRDGHIVDISDISIPGSVDADFTRAVIDLTKEARFEAIPPELPEKLHICLTTDCTGIIFRRMRGLF